MTAWIVTVGEGFPDHVGFAVEDGWWDTRKRMDIRSGDEVFFWLSGTGLVGWVDVTSDLRELRLGDPQAHWHDVHTGGYKYRFGLRERSSRTIGRTWKSISDATGIRQPLGHGILKIPSTEEAYFRSLFGEVPAIRESRQSRVDFQFNPEVYAPGEDVRERAVREIAIRRGQSTFRDSLVDAYDATCAITGSTVLSILEAAHIDRYFGDQTITSPTASSFAATSTRCSIFSGSQSSTSL